MRCLTIRQPWASLIIEGHKDVENRSWYTQIRGPIAIHAGRTIDLDGMTRYGHLLESVPTGCILGTVDIVDCIEEAQSEWAITGRWHWVLDNPVRFDKLISAKGQLGFWTIALSKRQLLSSWQDH